MTQVHVLDAIDAPLNGNILIEASAGTGKTFTITTLLLRFLLGLNEGSAPLKLENILIVTFTNAATAELKERVFRRIVELRSALLHNSSDDSVLLDLIAKIDSGNYSIDRNEAIAKLIMAERSIDQASIFTIHGFCQRVISQYAFSANLSFGVELNQDMDALLDQSIHQFWRQECYLFSRPLTYLSSQCYQSPVNIKLAIRPYIRNPKLLQREEGSVITEREALEQYFQPLFKMIEDIRKIWLSESEEIEAIIRESDVDRRSYSTRNLPNWIGQVTHWANQSESLNIPGNLYKFTEELLLEKTKEGGDSPQHPIFSLISQLLTLETELENERILMLFAVHHILNHFDQLKEEKREIGFDDILIQLSRVLEQGESERLIKLIRHNYQAVMIDEFQDTDGYQYSIFRELFLDSPLSFIMIGDPKQSIYKFRGADIYVYLEAKKSADIVYTLDTNYRSSASVVSGVNTLFSLNTHPFIEESIPFYSVKNADNAEDDSLHFDEVPLKGIHFIVSDIESNRATYLEIMAEKFADDSVQLLQKGKLITGNEHRKVLPADITFLVRSGAEAKIIQEALISRGLNAVYLSERSNVFDSVMAQEILVLLQSLLAPRNVRLIKRLLSSLLFGLSIDQYHSIIENEANYEAHLVEREDLKYVWDRYGVLALIRAIIMKDDRLAQLQSLNDGERLVTDLFHLAEILQEKRLPTHQMLVEWLEERLDDLEKDEAYHLRLESDFEAIKILTLHKSKGLEFPIVMMPFTLSYLRYREATPFFDRKQAQLRYLFSPDAETQDLILQEELAEAMRLFYVGVTRAKYHCRLGFAPNIVHGRRKQPIAPASALGYLLNLTNDNYQLPETILGDQNIGYSFFDAETIAHHYYMAEERSYGDESAAVFTQVIDHHWRFTSFSHLSYHAESSYFEDEHLDETLDEILDETLMNQLDEHNLELADFDLISSDLSSSEGVDPIFLFPRGVNTGNLLHHLLESSTPSDLQDEAHLAVALKASPLYGECESHFEESVTTLNEWFTHVLETQFSCGASLKSILEGDQHINELEFLYPIKQQLTPTKVDALLEQHREGQMKAYFDFESLTGMLRGFIDLTFYWEGKYYICDYKSNYLGDSIEQYEGEALTEAIYRANYDWQYLLYTVALVKFLRLHNPHFSYEDDFGGIYYLFLRGMRKDSMSGIYFNKPDEALIEIIEQTFMGEGL